MIYTSRGFCGPGIQEWHGWYWFRVSPGCGWLWLVLQSRDGTAGLGGSIAHKPTLRADQLGLAFGGRPQLLSSSTSSQGGSRVTQPCIWLLLEKFKGLRRQLQCLFGSALEVKHCHWHSLLLVTGKPWFHILLCLFKLDFILKGNWVTLESAWSFWSLFSSFLKLLWWVWS